MDRTGGSQKDRTMKEDKYVFPYTSPTKKAREKYKEIFALKEPLKERPSKWIFDRVFSIIAVTLASPIFLAIVIAYKINATFFPEDRGTILTF